jgi:hypothetical protein
MSTYRIEWSITLDADDPIDAAKQAWAEMDDATSHNYGATVVFVEEYEGDGSDRQMLDMEEVMKSG